MKPADPFLYDIHLVKVVWNYRTFYIHKKCTQPLPAIDTATPTQLLKLSYPHSVGLGIPLNRLHPFFFFCELLAISTSSFVFVLVL